MYTTPARARAVAAPPWMLFHPYIAISEAHYGVRVRTHRARTRPRGGDRKARRFPIFKGRRSPIDRGDTV